MSWVSSFAKKNPRTVGTILGGTIIGGPAGYLAGYLIGDYLSKQSKKKEKSNSKSSSSAKKKKSSGGGGGESMASQLAAYLQYNPKLAEQYWTLAQAYEPKYAELARDLTAREREADLATVLKLAPQMQDVRRGAEDPYATATRDELWRQILTELKAGSEMTPEEDRQVQQATRSALFARGMGQGTSGAVQESMRRALSGRALLNQRQQKAMGMLSQDAASTPDPFAAILGRSATAMATGVGQVNAANTLGNQVINASQQNALSWKRLSNDQAKYNLTLQLAQMNPYLQG